MSDLVELYQELVLDHNNRPRNKRVMEDASNTADGYNPLCGDQVSVFVKVENGVVADVSFQGVGCAISQSSASMMTQNVKGKPVEEAEALFELFHSMVTRDPERGLRWQQPRRVGGVGRRLRLPESHQVRQSGVAHDVGIVGHQERRARVH